MYSKMFLQKILGQLDFFVSLAQISTPTFELLQSQLVPEKLSILIRMMIASSSSNLTVLSILENLIALDIPIEILDKAVNESLSDSETQSSSEKALDKRVATLLKRDSSLDLSHMPFLKVLYSLILQHFDSIWNGGIQMDKG